MGRPKKVKRRRVGGAGPRDGHVVEDDPEVEVENVEENLRQWMTDETRQVQELIDEGEVSDISGIVAPIQTGRVEEECGTGEPVCSKKYPGEDFTWKATRRLGDLCGWRENTPDLSTDESAEVEVSDDYSEGVPTSDDECLAVDMERRQSSRQRKPTARFGDSIDHSDEFNRSLINFSSSISTQDKRLYANEIQDAKEREVNGWLERKVIETIDRNGVPEDAQIIGMTWVLSWKLDSFVNRTAKARLVARGNEEDRVAMVTYSPTFKKDTFRFVLQVAASKDWTPTVIDVKKGFLNSDPIHREVFLRPPKELNCGNKTIWKLNRAVYGLSDASRECWKTIRRHIEEIGFACSMNDPGLFIARHKDGSLRGLLLLHVNVILILSRENLKMTLKNSLRERGLELSIQEPRENQQFQFLGNTLAWSYDRSFGCLSYVIGCMDYYDMIEEIVELANPSDQISEEKEHQIRQVIDQLTWVVNINRPDLAVRVNKVHQGLCSEKNGMIIRKVNKLIRKAKKHQFVKLKIIGFERIDLLCYADAALTKTGCAQNGHCLVAKHCGISSASLLFWKSKKNPRSVTSSLAAEAYSLFDTADKAAHYRNLINELQIGNYVRDIYLLTDCENLAKCVLHETSVPSERDVLQYVNATRSLMLGNNLRLLKIPTSFMLADTFSKERDIDAPYINCRKQRNSI